MTPSSAALLRNDEPSEAAPKPAAEARARPTAAPVEAVPAPLAPELWRDGRFEADDWTYAAADEAVPEGPAIVTFARFLAEHDALAGRNAPLGVLVQPNEAISELADHLGRVALVALAFPKFSDGRASSSARLLRERYGFTGEVRATGDVLIDQMPLMARCGFDAFEVTDAPTRAQLAEGKWPDVPFYLQPVGSSRQAEVPAGTRPWARRPG